MWREAEFVEYRRGPEEVALVGKLFERRPVLEQQPKCLVDQVGLFWGDVRAGFASSPSHTGHVLHLALVGGGVITPRSARADQQSIDGDAPALLDADSSLQSQRPRGH